MNLLQRLGRSFTAFLFLFFLSCINPILRLGGLPEDVLCIAVIPFEVRYEAPSSEEILSEFLSLDLYRMGAKGTLGPRELTQLFQRTRNSLPSFVTTTSAKLIGNKLAVDAVIFGSTSRIPLLRDVEAEHQETELNIDAYLLDVRSGIIRWAYGTKETIETENYIDRMNFHSEKMAQSLLFLRKGGDRFGKRNCWSIPPEPPKEVTSAMLTQPTSPSVSIPLTTIQKELLARLSNSEGIQLGPDMLEEREDRLTKKAIPLLREVASVVKGAPTLLAVRIASHVDATQDTADDLKISKLRAEAIKQYLIFIGLPERQLEAVGFGGTQPLVPNINRKTRSMNRRIVITTIEASPSPTQ